MNDLVVNIRDLPHPWPESWPDDLLYIGRGMYRLRLPWSQFANPFRIGDHGSRDDVLRLYEDHIRNSPQLIAALPQLRDKRLACWCAPTACHGDVLLRLLDEFHPTVSSW